MFFSEFPASKVTAWLLTIMMFFTSAATLSAAKIIRYKIMSEDLGFQINPSNPLEIAGAFVFAWLFYGFLNTKQRNEKSNVKRIKENVLEAVEQHGNDTVQCVDATIEDQFYENAWAEIENNNQKKSLWAKSYSECNGDNDQTKAKYITLRVNELRQEERSRLQNEQKKNEEALKNRSDSELMRHYGIVYDGVHYRFETYKYSKLSDAVNYAKNKQI